MSHSLRYRRVNSILANIPLHPKVIRIRALVFLECTALHFILMRGIPRTQNDFAAAAHGLRVRRHHGYSAEVVQDVFRGDGLGADARFGEGDVFGDVAREVVAYH